jgi:hypothetical protein
MIHVVWEKRVANSVFALLTPADLKSLGNLSTALVEIKFGIAQTVLFFTKRKNWRLQHNEFQRRYK